MNNINATGTNETGTITRAAFAIGQLVHHKLYDYRGVVFDIDPCFQGSDEWYDSVARSRPSRNQPWYHVLVDDGQHSTYVAESNLEPDQELQPVHHPALKEHFQDFAGGSYLSRQTAH